jgi:hypothetical protein
MGGTQDGGGRLRNLVRLPGLDGLPVPGSLRARHGVGVSPSPGRGSPTAGPAGRPGAVRA